MDIELDKTDNWLKHWRENRGYPPTKVDTVLGWCTGTTVKYEKIGIGSIPCCDLYQLVRLYEVDPEHFFEVVDNVIRQLSRSRPH